MYICRVLLSPIYEENSSVNIYVGCSARRILRPRFVPLGTVGFKKKGGGRLAVVRPPGRVAGDGSHDAATLRASFQLSFQIALAFAAAHLFLLGKDIILFWSF